jgi:hypothetical protein
LLKTRNKPYTTTLATSKQNRSKLKKIGFIILSLLMISCSYKLYVTENIAGRKELKSKNFDKKFNSEMLKEIDENKIYFHLYEATDIVYKNYSYLRLFPKGQYAMFYENTNNVPNLNELENANHVGYYIVENGNLKLETPTGNGNTFGYRIVNKFRIKNDTLVEYDNRISNRNFVGKVVSELLNVEPDW